VANIDLCDRKMKFDQADIKYDQEILIIISLILVLISEYEIAKRKFNQINLRKNQFIPILNHFRGLPKGFL
jgi:hypothetical protein